MATATHSWCSYAALCVVLFFWFSLIARKEPAMPLVRSHSTDREDSAEIPCRAAAPCWARLETARPDIARRFYGALLGWEFEQCPGLGGHPYIRARVGNCAVAGLAASAEELAGRPEWTVHLGVEDADRVAGVVRERGGTVAVGPLGFDGGRLAVAADPQGAVFGIWQSAGPSSGCDGVTGRAVWSELETADPFAAAMFYAEVFGWDRRADIDIRFEQEQVTVWAEGRPVAGIRGISTDHGTRRWHVGFSVRDAGTAASQAEKLRGRALGITDTPSGRLARLADPEGGRFLVLDGT